MIYNNRCTVCGCCPCVCVRTVYKITNITGPTGPTGPTGATGPVGLSATFVAASPVEDATDSSNIITQFNKLLTNLRTAGILKEYHDTEIEPD